MAPAGVPCRSRLSLVTRVILVSAFSSYLQATSTKVHHQIPTHSMGIVQMAGKSRHDHPQIHLKVCIIIQENMICNIEIYICVLEVTTWSLLAVKLNRKKLQRCGQRYIYIG